MCDLSLDIVSLAIGPRLAFAIDHVILSHDHFQFDLFFGLDCAQEVLR